MLDDLKYIHQKDTQDALTFAEKQWYQLHTDFVVKPAVGTKNYSNVVFAGMGGSALAAELFKSWATLSVPFEIIKNYDIPKYVNEDTLFIVSSYSGNTEEALSALAGAEKQHATVVVITSGGQLAKSAKEKDIPLVILPEGFQPRVATLSSLKALITLLDNSGLTNGLEDELEKASEHIEQAVKQWRPDVATKQNRAKQIALDIIGKSPVIYGGPLLASVAYKWKISFNENAKNVAWCNTYPEFNHNEFVGWSSHPVDKPYAVIDLRSSFDHPQIKKRFELSARLLSGKRPAPIVVEAEGKTELEQLLWTVVLGDFVSIYTALLNGVNPTPVDLIEKLKKEL